MAMGDKKPLTKKDMTADAAEKGGYPNSGLVASMAAGGIIKLAAGVADMRPKILNRQMSTASFDLNSRQYEQVCLWIVHYNTFYKVDKCIYIYIHIHLMLLKAIGNNSKMH